jgi:hypothetical protein
MAQRIDRFHAARHTNRGFLEWLAVAALSVLAALALTCNVRAGEWADAGLMVRAGIDAELDVQDLPADGWYRVTSKQGALQVVAVTLPMSAPGEEEAEAVDTRYIRVPGARIAEGRLPVVAFADGVLAPRADSAYQLALGDRPFTLTVSADAVFTVHTGDDSYSFRVDADMEAGVTVMAAADIDSDGKPDFIVQAGDVELLLLSSRTAPGINPPAAVLALHDGC